MKKEIQNILEKRYFTKDEQEWSQLVNRVSAIYPEIKSLMLDMRFIPSSPTLMAANNPYSNGCLSSCFPLSIDDSMDDIGRAMDECCRITKAGGGVGYNFSNLRSSKEKIKGCGDALSSGPLSFERIFNQILNEIQQGGKRRGAGMAAYDIDHPDILEIIESKRNVNDNRYKRFNHSKRVTDEFFKKLLDKPDSYHNVLFKDGHQEMLLDKDGKPVIVKELWDLLMTCAWESGEPGILNIDIATRQNPITNDRNQIASNPCCLVPETIIDTDIGPKTIQELLNMPIRPKVLTIDVVDEDGLKIEIPQPRWEKIKAIWCAKRNATVVKIGLVNGEHLIATPDHKLWTNYGYKEIRDLQKGKELVFSHNKFVEVKYISYEKEKRDVYDLTTPINHNFVANGILVHNSEFTHVVNSSCNLGSLNLSKYVKNNKFDFDFFKEDIKKAIRFLDRVIDVNNFPTKSIEKTTKDVRPIGLGIMGLHSLFTKLDLAYTDKESLKLTQKIIDCITITGLNESIELAKENGPYPLYNQEKYLEANKRFINRPEYSDVKEKIIKYGIRNSVITSIAPCGTISFIADVSSGLEPYPFLIYIRRIEQTNSDGISKFENVNIYTRDFDEYIEKHCPEKRKIIENWILSHNGSIQGCPDVSDRFKELFKVAGDLTPGEHLDIVEIFAGRVQTSISKTINLKKETTKEEISDVYIDTWKRGIIGCTIYRDGCREGVLVTKESDGCNCKEKNSDKRPEYYDAEVKITVIKGVPYYVAVSKGDGCLKEVFAGINLCTEEDKIAELYIPKKTGPGKIKRIKSGNYEYIENDTGKVYKILGKHSTPECELVTRLISHDLRRCVDLQEIIEQLEKTKSSGQDYVKAIWKILKEYLEDGIKTGEICSCGTEMIRISGCKSCPNCGMSKCG